jgi:large subunit ribosomal protein L4
VKVNKKMRAAALRSALADKASDGRIFVIDGFSESKTKAAAAALAGAGIEGRVLIVLDPDDESSVSVDRAFRNLSDAAFTLYGSLGTFDVIVADAIVFTKSALEHFSSRSKAGGDAS